MYNENQKMEYLNSRINVETTKNTITSVFNTAEIVEAKWDMDLCYFNRPQIIDLLKSYNSISKNRLRSICSYLSDYYNWCLNEKHLVSDIVNYYDKSLSESIVDSIIPVEQMNGKFFDKQTMLKYLNQIIDPSNKFIAYSLWLGIKGSEYEEIRNIKPEDLNEQEKTITLFTGRVVRVDDFYIKLLKETYEAEFYFPNGEDPNNLKTYNTNKYVNNGYVLKQSGMASSDNSNPITSSTINSRMRHIKKQIGNELILPTTIYKNGLINYIKERFSEQGITLKDGFTVKVHKNKYQYENQIQEFIYEFGSNVTTRMLRMEIIEYINTL